MPFETSTTVAPPSETSSPSAMPASTNMPTTGVVTSASNSSELTTTMLPDATTAEEEPTTTASSRNVATTLQSEDWIEYDYYYDEDAASTEAPKATNAFTPQVVTHVMTQVQDEGAGQRDGNLQGVSDSEHSDYYYEDADSTGTEATEALTLVTHASEAFTSHVSTSASKGTDQAKPRISDVLGPYYLVKMAVSENSGKKPLWLIWNPSDGSNLADAFNISSIENRGDHLPTTALPRGSTTGTSEVN